MTVAAFKDLCIDANDPLALARFWQQILGGTVVKHRDGSARIDPPPGRGDNERIWVNLVPEPRVGKTRLHYDLWLPSPDPQPLLDAGARVLTEPDEDHWWQLTDPEGNVFCAFPPDEHTPAQPRGLAADIFQLTVDCRDAQAEADWWASVLGGSVQQESYGPKLRSATGFPWPDWLFQSVPEPKTVKNRLHWDVSLADPTPQALVAQGATVLREPGGDISWWVLADREGNEFCGFPPK